MTPTLLFAAALLTGPALPDADCGCRARVDQAQPPGLAPTPTPDPIGGPGGAGDHPPVVPNHPPVVPEEDCECDCDGDGEPDEEQPDPNPDGSCDCDCGPQNPPTPPPPTNPPPGGPPNPPTGPNPPPTPPPGGPQNPTPGEASIEIEWSPEQEPIVLGDLVVGALVVECEGGGATYSYQSRCVLKDSNGICDPIDGVPWPPVNMMPYDPDSRTISFLAVASGDWEFRAVLNCGGEVAEDITTLTVLPPDKVELEGTDGPSSAGSMMSKTVRFRYTAAGRDLGPHYQPTSQEQVWQSRPDIEPPDWDGGTGWVPTPPAPPCGQIQQPGYTPTICYTSSHVRDTKWRSSTDEPFASAEVGDVFRRIKQRVRIEPWNCCWFDFGKWESDDFIIENVKASDDTYTTRVVEGGP